MASHEDTPECNILSSTWTFCFFFHLFGLYIGFEQVVESIAFNEGPNFILDR